MHTIEFVKENQKVRVSEGSNLRRQAIDCGIELYKGVTKVLNCRGKGKCGNCRVEIVSGADNLSAPSPAEIQKLKQNRGNYRLACQTQIKGNVAVKTKPN